MSGDRAAVDQIREVVGDLESAPVKHGLQEATISVSPERGQQMIREGVTRAIRRISQFKPYKPSAPHRVEIDFSAESQAALATWVPSITRTAARTIAFAARGMAEAMKLTRLLVIYVGQ